MDKTGPSSRLLSKEMLPTGMLPRPLSMPTHLAIVFTHPIAVVPPTSKYNACVCVKLRDYRAPPSVYTQPLKQHKKGGTSTSDTERKLYLERD